MPIHHFDMLAVTPPFALRKFRRACISEPVRRMRMALAGVLLAMLAACSPSHDWREVKLADGQVRAMFPDKPLTTERDFQFEGHDITFSLSSANVDNVLYTVGHAPLPQALRDDPQASKRFLTQTRASLYQNMGVAVPPEPADPSKRFAIEGTSQGQHLLLQAQVWTTSHALVEGIVVGEASNFPQQHADEFFRELAPGQRPGQIPADPAAAS